MSFGSRLLFVVGSFKTANPSCRAIAGPTGGGYSVIYRCMSLDVGCTLWLPSVITGCGCPTRLKKVDLKKFDLLKCDSASRPHISLFRVLMTRHVFHWAFHLRFFDLDILAHRPYSHSGSTTKQTFLTDSRSVCFV